jgi:P22_AR N-terminal domain
MTRIIAVDFRGAEILGVELEGVFYVVLKPVVEALGLAWNGQLERVKRNQVLSEGMRMIRIPFMRGGDQDAVTLRLDRIHGWLFTIDASRVKKEIRELVQIYQRECHEVLHRHFSGEAPKLEQQRQESESQRVRMVTEARQTFGQLAAAERWKQLGLPMVSEMENVLAQGDLFRRAA